MTTVITRVLSTLAIVGLWGVVNRTSRPTGDFAEASLACELAPPRDVGGLEACLARAPRDVELLIDLGRRLRVGRPAGRGRVGVPPGRRHGPARRGCAPSPGLGASSRRGPRGRPARGRRRPRAQAERPVRGGARRAPGPLVRCSAMRALAFAAARLLNALYFVASFFYCLLSYSTFAYEQFIRPQLIGWLPDSGRPTPPLVLADAAGHGSYARARPQAGPIAWPHRGRHLSWPQCRARPLAPRQPCDGACGARRAHLARRRPVPDPAAGPRGRRPPGRNAAFASACRRAPRVSGRRHGSRGDLALVRPADSLVRLTCLRRRSAARGAGAGSRDLARLAPASLRPRLPCSRRGCRRSGPCSSSLRRVLDAGSLVGGRPGVRAQPRGGRRAVVPADRIVGALGVAQRGARGRLVRPVVASRERRECR